MGKDVDISYFLAKPERFPWDWYGGYPISGNVHNYLCRIMSEFSNNYGFIQAVKNPITWREFESFMVNSEKDTFLESIHKYCSEVYSHHVFDRLSVSAEVLGYLKTNHLFKKSFQERLNYLYIRDLITIPDIAKPIGDSNDNR